MSRPASSELAGNCFALSIIAAFLVPVFAALAFAVAADRNGWAFAGLIALTLIAAFAALVEFLKGARHQQQADLESTGRTSAATPLNQ